MSADAAAIASFTITSGSTSSAEIEVIAQPEFSPEADLFIQQACMQPPTWRRYNTQPCQLGGPIKKLKRSNSNL